MQIINSITIVTEYVTKADCTSFRARRFRNCFVPLWHRALLEYVNRARKPDIAIFACGFGWRNEMNVFETQLGGHFNNLVRLDFNGCVSLFDVLCEILGLLVARKRLNFQDKNAVVAQLTMNFEQKQTKACVSPIEMNPFHNAQTKFKRVSTSQNKGYKGSRGAAYHIIVS